MKPSNTTKKTLSLFWHYTRKYKFLFWVGSLGSVFGVIAQETLPPLIMDLV